MEILSIILFLFCGFIIFWAMVGYPISLRIIHKIVKPKPLKKDYTQCPSVTILVVAHNEEKVIYNKLLNLMQISYPISNLKILISSDNSTDKTDLIVKSFIQEHIECDIRLYQVQERKGKTNAQNEAVRTVDTDFIIFTDANSLLDKDAVTELVASFTSRNISYVCGRLVYINGDLNETAKLESSYWDLEIQTRKLESELQTIVAGNGALYALRKDDYFDINLMESHDTAFPFNFAIQRKKALFNDKALVYEKAGENIRDEFKRKVRMRRRGFSSSIISLKPLNIFKYKWFTYFYIGHRYLRDILWIAHIMLLISNIFLSFRFENFTYVLIIHLLIYLLSFIQHHFQFNIKFIRFLYYYMITVLAQFVGVYKQLTGKSKSFWDKAESTR